MNIKPVEIVVVRSIIPVYKDGEEANNINVINFNFLDGSECGYNVVAQKGLYKIGDKALYIMPDYCLSDIPLFDDFTKPFGDVKKSRLGKNNRIRAIKFNFNFYGTSEPIYSFGVLMPISDLSNYFSNNDILNCDNLVDLLGITKYEEPETSGNGLVKGDLPSFLYATDETNSMNLKTHINMIIDSGEKLGYTIKRDGSSWTMYIKKDGDEWVYGICSRNQEKKIIQRYIDKYVDENGNIYHKYINPETKEKGWYCDELLNFLTDDEIKDLKAIEVEVKDSWVELANKYNLPEKALQYAKDNNLEFALRGEIYGQGLKGSGNKLNPDSKNPQTLTLFGIDTLESGRAERINYSSEHNLKNVSEKLGVDYTEVKEIAPTSFEHLIELAEVIFKEFEKDGKIIEGIVVRTMYSNNLSCKILNSYYDSKK